jgi:hypothetical protein
MLTAVALFSRLFFWPSSICGLIDLKRDDHLLIFDNIMQCRIHTNLASLSNGNDSSMIYRRPPFGGLAGKSFPLPAGSQPHTHTLSSAPFK